MMKAFVVTNLSRLRWCRRLSNDRGVAMLYTAVICMFILAVFSLIYDVARISEDKIQMQNAADAAALEFATWQARGMNTVQNLNQEIFNLDTAVLTMYLTAAGAVYAGTAAAILTKGAALPLKNACDIFAAFLMYGGIYVHHVVGIGMLQSLRHFYAYGTNVLAIISANEIATMNRADPILPEISFNVPSNAPALMQNIMNIIYGQLNAELKTYSVLCIPFSHETLFTLPLELKEGKNIPLNLTGVLNPELLVDAPQLIKDLIYDIRTIITLSYQAYNQGEDQSDVRVQISQIQNLLIELQKQELNILDPDRLDLILDTLINSVLGFIMSKSIILNPYTTITLPLGGWEIFTWQDSYYRSIAKYNAPGKTSLAPVLAVVRKKQNPGLMSRYLLKAELPISVTAYAVARCEGGNVVAHYKANDSMHRSESHGVSASAVLVPFSKISEVLLQEQEDSQEISGVMKLLNSIFLH